MDITVTSKSHRILFLNTLAFTICFAAWMINGVLVTFLVDNGVFNWSPIEIGWLLGVPVLVGSVFRLPIGMLTDRIGGRWVMGGLLLLCAIPMFLLSQAHDFQSFLLLSFGFGLTGSSFACGVAYTCIWYPKERQGTALGIFGAGNLGASLTTMFAPTLLKNLTNDGANVEAWRELPQWYAAVLLVTGVIFLLGTENRKPTEMKSLGERMAPLKEIRVWRFGLYYFFVFGSFVALTQWLIPYYVNVYSLTIVAAGFMVTTFSLPTGLIRAPGGWLADKIGARQVLYWVFGTSIICLIFLFVPRMEIQAPGQGIMAAQAGVVISMSDHEIQIDDIRYPIQSRHDSTSVVKIRYGIHHSDEGFLPLPTASFWQEPLVRVGDAVSKGQLIAKGVTRIYFQANRWIFSGLVFIIGIMMGIGSAAVFKHVSDYYPKSVGTVGGIVGVLGGLGGFFGPLLFGFFLRETGIWTTCFMFLAVIALICIILQRFAVKAIMLADTHQKEMLDRRSRWQNP